MIRVMCVWLALLAPALSAAQEPKILVMGDSLSAAYGIAVQQGWVALLQQRLQRAGYAARVVNASISGETSAGGLARLPAALKQHRPGIVLIELGANDALRGLKLATLRENLLRMIALSRDAGARALLFEMRIPENYGADYTRGFTASFGEVAKKTRTPLVSFFLLPLVADPIKWFQDDGIHPNASAQPLMLERVWPALEKLLSAKPS